MRIDFEEDLVEEDWLAEAKDGFSAVDISVDFTSRVFSVLSRRELEAVDVGVMRLLGLFGLVHALVLVSEPLEGDRVDLIKEIFILLNHPEHSLLVGIP